jgi:hypothetical protein
LRRQSMERLTRTCLDEHFEIAETGMESSDQINHTGHDCTDLVSGYQVIEGNSMT